MRSRSLLLTPSCSVEQRGKAEHADRHRLDGPKLVGSAGPSDYGRVLQARADLIRAVQLAISIPA